MSLLVRTPTAYFGESPLGFLLRCAEMNGFRSAATLLTIAGAHDLYWTRLTLPIEALASLGLDRKNLLSTAYVDVDEDSRTAVRVYGAVLSRRCIRLRSPALCVLCTRENGYLDSLWDLSYFDSCPVHGCGLTRSCTECGHRLIWRRPEMLKCHCGALLERVERRRTDDCTFALEQALAKSLTKRGGDSLGFPWDELSELGPAALLNFIHAIASHQPSLPSSAGTCHGNVMRSASRLFSSLSHCTFSPFADPAEVERKPMISSWGSGPISCTSKVLGLSLDRTRALSEAYQLNVVKVGHGKRAQRRLLISLAEFLFHLLASGDARAVLGGSSKHAGALT